MHENWFTNSQDSHYALAMIIAEKLGLLYAPSAGLFRS